MKQFQCRSLIVNYPQTMLCIRRLSHVVGGDSWSVTAVILLFSSPCRQNYFAGNVRSWHRAKLISKLLKIMHGETPVNFFKSAGFLMRF